MEFHQELSCSIQEIDVEDDAKSNGNHVNLEKQMTRMTPNGLECMLLGDFLHSEIQTIKSAITDGGKA